MANVYYKIDGNDIYYTNEEKVGYTLRDQDSNISRYKNVIIELYNDKFIFPQYSGDLFNGALNTSFDTSKWDTSDAISITYLFCDCSNLTSIDVSNFDTSNIVYMYRTFRNCTSLTTLDLSTWDTSKLTDMQQTFSYSNNLKKVDISSWDTSKVTTMEAAFSGCTSLEKILVGEGFSTRGIQYWTYGQSMFSNCTSLVGEKGTAYNNSHQNSDYARIDNPPDAPGYLTLKKPEWIEHDVYIKENGVWKLVEVYN